jgi:alkylhydroperoxidase/carboxymuconolactone decarboxylase family protein YurZ
VNFLKGLAMEDKFNLISDAFKTFLTEAPEHAKVWGEAVQGLSKAGALDPKTGGLAYLAVLASLNRVSGIPFHVASLKEMGVTREEVISAILVGLPAAGHVVTQALPAALETFDSD